MQTTITYEHDLYIAALIEKADQISAQIKEVQRCHARSESTPNKS